MSIKIKLNLLLTLSLLFFALALSVIVDYFFTTKFQREFEQKLTQTKKNFEDIIEERKINLQIKTTLIAELPILTTVVENADPVTCKDSGATYKGKLNCSIFDIYDYDGEVLASVGLPIEDTERSFLEVPINQVIDEGMSVFMHSSRNGNPCLLSFVPIGTVDEPVGALVTGVCLDELFLMSLKEQTNSDIMLLEGQDIVSTTLPIDVSQSIVDESRGLLTNELMHLSTHMILPIDFPIHIDGRKYKVVLMHSEALLEADLKHLHGFILMTTLGIFVLVLAVSIYFSKNITKPIIEASTFATQLSKGNLSHSMSIARHDEVGVMLKAMEEMRLNLKDMIENLDEKIDEKTKQLESETLHATTAAEEAQRERDNAHDALMKSMESDQRFQEIVEEVKKMVEETKSFAKQTDLLALNATIEAVSAGKAGQSFGVVANEVQFLSQRINELTVRMGKKIQELKIS